MASNQDARLGAGGSSMRTHLFWAAVIAVALWQVELAIHAGIAAAKKQASKPQAQQCEPCQQTPQLIKPATTKSK